MKVVFYDDGQIYSKTALTFFAELFGATEAAVTILTVDTESAAKITGHTKNAQEMLRKKGFKDVSARTYSGPPQQVIKQELGAKNSAAILVKGVPDMNPIIAEVAERDVDVLTEKIIGSLKNSILLVKNPPKQLRKVLICTDGSAEAESAIQFFINLKLKPSPQVKILNVIPAAFKFFTSFLEPAGESELAVLVKIKNKRTAFLYRAKQTLIDAGIKVKIKLRTGNVMNEIIKESAKDFDLIVLGLRGRKANRRDIVGSRTKEVLIMAKCSVLAVRGGI